MLPIRDHNPARGTPFVTWGLIAANIGIFIWYWSGLDTDLELGRFYFEWGLVPRLASERPETLVTSMFLHGGILHLLGNMLFLWIYGDNLEDEMGHLGFLGFYLATGLLAAGAQVLSDPSSLVPVVGASGAIAGVMGGYLLLFPRARIDFLIFLVVFIRILPIPAWIVLLSWFVLQLAQGSIVSPEDSGVAYWAHAGGFVAGLLLTLPVWLRRGAMSFWRKTSGRPRHPETQYRYVRSDIPSVPRRSRDGRTSPWQRR